MSRRKPFSDKLSARALEAAPLILLRRREGWSQQRMIYELRIPQDVVRHVCAVFPTLRGQHRFDVEVACRKFGIGRGGEGVGLSREDIGKRLHDRFPDIFPGRAFSIMRHLRDSGVTSEQADRIATALNVDAEEIWPEYPDVVAEEDAVEQANRDRLLLMLEAAAVEKFARRQQPPAIDPVWREATRKAMRALAEQREFFTLDDLWESGVEKPTYRGATIGMARWAVLNGLVTDSFQTKPSETAKCGYIRIWKSLIYRPEPA